MAAPKIPTNTRWVNPTDKTVKLDLCVSANADPNGSDSRWQLEIPPVGTVLTREQQESGRHQADAEGKLLFTVVPSEYDMGIHLVRDGKIVGGGAPQLRRFEEPNPRIEPSLEPDALALREAEKVKAQKEAEAAEAERQRLLAAANASGESKDGKGKSGK